MFAKLENAKFQAYEAVQLLTYSTVLLVESEPEVIAPHRDALAAAGFQILTALTGDQALDICSHSKQRVDLVICRVVLEA